MVGYKCRFIPQELEHSVCEYYRMSRATLWKRIDRLRWTVDRVMEVHKDQIKTTRNGVYKDVDCLTSQEWS